jgi:hypothetical protein
MGNYFVGPINPPGKNTGARYIIIATEYLKTWEEERVVKDCSATTTTRFIFEDIITRFGCPKDPNERSRNTLY